MMISPISSVSFRGNDAIAGLKNLTAMDAIEKTQKAMETVTNLKEGTDEFKKNMETDSVAYSDAITSNLAKAAEIMASTPGALHLRTLSTINDVSSDQSNTIIFAIPLEIMDAFKQGNGTDVIKKAVKKK